MTRAVKTAADMPPGTEVDWSMTRWTKNRPGDQRPWTDNLGKTHPDEHIDRVLRHGALIGHIPSGPGRWPTRYMPVGTVIEYDGETYRKTHDSRREPFPWTSHNGADGDEWAARAIANGATITYPERR